jgi:Holliday junction DNA helicase RuvB
MEQFKVDVIIGKGPGAKTIPLNLSPFTLIGATTRSGLLTAPLRDRFGALFHLGFYGPEDLAEIIRRKAREHGITIGDECLLAIAARSRGTPRVALRLFKRVWDFAVVAGSNEISRELAEESLKRLGITDEGLDEMDRRILTLIIRNFSGGPVGIATLSAVLNEERDTLEDVYEPYLMKAGFLEKTPRGRCATQKAYEYFRVPFAPARMQGGAVEPLFGNEESCEETEG